MMNIGVNLQFINFSNNKLSSLPTEMKLLANLREICLNCNKFDAIPNCLYVCGKLETLLISDNQIKEIDIDGLRELTKLAIIDLGNNNIASVPPELGNLRNIRSLTLDGNSCVPAIQIGFLFGLQAARVSEWMLLLFLVFLTLFLLASLKLKFICVFFLGTKTPSFSPRH